MSDPLIRAIAEANPVSETDFADLPPLRLPHPRASTRRRLIPIAALCALAASLAFALAPSGTPGSDELLKRALAAPNGSEILYWRLKTSEPGLGFDFTNDLWLRVNQHGVVDRIHELRLDSPYAGIESAFIQPNGLGDPRGAVDWTRRSANGPVRRSEGYGYPDLSFSGVIAKALDASNGKLDAGAATEVRYGGRDAYEIRLKEATPPTPPSTRRSPAQVSVTLWLDRESAQPLAVRWGEGGELWRTVEVQAFERLDDSPANRRLLELSAPR
jgi:hypothetical protein